MSIGLLHPLFKSLAEIVISSKLLRIRFCATFQLLLEKTRHDSS